MSWRYGKVHEITVSCDIEDCDFSKLFRWSSCPPKGKARGAAEDKGWEFVDGEARCPFHNTEDVECEAAVASRECRIHDSEISYGEDTCRRVQRRVEA